MLISDYVSDWAASVFGPMAACPWDATARAVELVGDALRSLGEDYAIDGGIAVHRTATLEPGAIIKPPALVGPACFVAASAYLRGGVFLADGCTVGPGVEIKSSFLFGGSACAHFNFVGDTIIGRTVNLEAGAVLANYRNEAPGRTIAVCVGDSLIDTGTAKFGALIGDDVRIGANAVLAPGTIIQRGARIGRLQLVDRVAEMAPHLLR